MRNERTRLRTWIASLLAIVIGGILLYISQQFEGHWYGRLINDCGSIIIASVALVLVFDYWQKEAFFTELFKAARNAEQVQKAGISGFSASFHDEVPWDEFFRRSTTLDIFFCYGSTWRNTHGHRLDAFLKQDKARIRIVLPDPNFDIVVGELSLRFNTESLLLKAKIKEAIDFFFASQLPVPRQGGALFVSKKHDAQLLPF